MLTNFSKHALITVRDADMILFQSECVTIKLEFVSDILQN